MFGQNWLPCISQKAKMIYTKKPENCRFNKLEGPNAFYGPCKILSEKKFFHLQTTSQGFVLFPDFGTVH